MKCLVCDAFFFPSKGHKTTQKYCCRKCGCNARHRLSRGLPIKNSLLHCAVCEKDFYQKRANNNQYCCHDCKRLAASRRLQGVSVKGPKKHIKGSGYITSQGYKILSRRHPNSSKRGQILEHVLVMATHLGRALRKDESVHHKNGVRHDNRLENLELWSKSTHYRNQRWGQSLFDKVSYFIEFLESYGCVIEKSDFVLNVLTKKVT